MSMKPKAILFDLDDTIDKLNRFGIEKYFELIIIDSEVGHIKPQKEIFQYTLNKLNLRPEEVWMVGDNLVWDIQGAQQLGIYSVWNDYDREGLPNFSDIQPDRIVGSIYEMAMTLQEEYY